MTRDYGYWVENQLRERYELEGVPVAIDFRKRYVNAVVVGGGAWGTAFAKLLRARGHDGHARACARRSTRRPYEAGRRSS